MSYFFRSGFPSGEREDRKEAETGERGSCLGQNSGLKLARRQPGERQEVGAKPKPSALPRGTFVVEGGEWMRGKRQPSWGLIQLRCCPVQSLQCNEPTTTHPHLEEEMATHSSILGWEITWTKEPGGLQFIGSISQTQLSMHARAHTHTHTHIHNLFPEHPHYFLAIIENWLFPWQHNSLESHLR